MTYSHIINRSQQIPKVHCANLVGVDEAGRGALAGPVVVAAVVLQKLQNIEGCKDSKVLSQRRRETLAKDIKEQALAWSIEYATLEEIKEFNVLNATLRAMARAVKNLNITSSVVLVDGNALPADMDQPCYAVIGGDARVNAISAASILAKVTRDNEMIKAHSGYPEYGFNAHKGYGTKEHLKALNDYGQCTIHRKEWRSVKYYSKSM